MKAFLLREYHQEMSLEKVIDPVAGPFDIILRVKACGVCGTDLKIISGKIPPLIVTLPHTPGHEIAGEVIAVGSEVTDVKIGQKGIVYFYIGCKDCDMCRTGRENLCFSLKRLGFELPGGFAELVKIPAYSFCPVEKGVPLDQMAILPDAVATPYHALTAIADVKMGQDVLIIGVGGLGIHAVQLAKEMGTRVFAVEIREEPLRLASTYGADFTLLSSGRNAREEILSITKGRGVDVIIENVGSTETFSWGLSCLKKGGRLILVGYDPSIPLSFNAMEMHYNEWMICGSRASTKQDLMEVIDLVQRGRIQPVISKRMEWERANEAIKEVHKRTGVGRTVLIFEP